MTTPPPIALTDDQIRQLIGWFNREREYLFALRSLAQDILIPRVRGTLECIASDIDFTDRVRQALRTRPIIISVEDTAEIVEIAASNRLVEKVEFWNSVVQALSGADHGQRINQRRDGLQ